MSLADVKARTEAARAAGIRRRYPEHRGKARRPAPPAPPCAHRGEELTGQEREALQLDHRKRWTLCLHESQPLGQAVCACMGCGPKCPGYSAGSPL